jgi:hypothetical protein
MHSSYPTSTRAQPMLRRTFVKLPWTKWSIIICKLNAKTLKTFPTPSTKQLSFFHPRNRTQNARLRGGYSTIGPLNVMETLYAGKSELGGKSDTLIKPCSSKNERHYARQSQKGFYYILTLQMQYYPENRYPHRCCSTKSSVLAAESICHALPLLRYTLPDYPYSEGITYKLASSHPCLATGTP